MDKFIPGLKLSKYFFEESIEPLMRQAFPGLSYSAARLEWGSDVIGFDTPMSMDHGWGPKMTLFLDENDFPVHHDRLQTYFAHHLPFEIRGFPTNFAEPYADGGVISPKTTHPIHHMITITTPERFFQEYLGVNIHQPLTPEIWLTLPQQRLRTIRAGQIFHDGLGTLEDIRQRFHWYPHDVWFYLMANQWQRIDQDEPFIGRTGIVDDELGSRLIAARLIRDLMALAFLMEKTYAPYRKWFGTAFNQLKSAPTLTPLFDAILNSQDWKERESHLSQAYCRMAEHHNALSITPFINPEVSHFYHRPFLVPHAARFADALLAEISDPNVKCLPPHLGSLDQLSDNTEVLDDISCCQQLRILYRPPKKP